MRKVRPARVRKVKGILNSNEQAYADELEEMKRKGEIEDYVYEGMQLNLGAPRTTYTPDFVVFTKDMLVELHECKAGQKTGKYFTQGNAVIKMKLCAQKWPWFKLVVTWKHPTYARQYKEIGGHEEV